MKPLDTQTIARYTDAGWWGTGTLSQRIAEHAASRPDTDAIVTPTGAMTYGEYHGAADRIVGQLADAGLRAGARVAVMMPDGPGVHATYVAIERLGGVVVGIGHRAGEREVRHLLALTGAEAIVTGPTIGHLEAGSFVSRLLDTSTDGLRHLLLADPSSNIPLLEGDRSPSLRVGNGCGIGPNDVFLMNSTSGTTGLPKCVVHTQNRWFYFHRLAAEAGDLSSEDVVLSAVPAPFGFGLWTAHFTPTVLGCPVVLMPRFSAELTLDLLERHRVTMLACVSTQFIMLMNEQRERPRDLSALRVMFTGGEAVPYDRAADFEERTGARVLQFYGSNETGALSVTTLRDDRRHRLTTAGRVIPEMNVRLLSEAGESIERRPAQGVPACRGPATCLGYAGADGADSGLFTSDGWMLMGDIVSIDEDGYLRVIGRVSDFIIRGGKNISAVAVEEEVATHPAVALAAAVPMQDPVFGERVCAVVELRAGYQALSLEELCDHLSARGVTREWHPERLIVRDELPRSSGGKVAKGVLRQEMRDWSELVERS